MIIQSFGEYTLCTRKSSKLFGKMEGKKEVGLGDGLISLKIRYRGNICYGEVIHNPYLNFMKAAPLKDIKFELKNKSKEEVVELCLLMSKHKKENKELLTYLLYDKQDEAGYVRDIKNEIDVQFEAINKGSYYYLLKGVRKVLRLCKKHIRYSKNKETEVEVLIYFCSKVKGIAGYYDLNAGLLSIWDKQLEIARKKIGGMHEDLKFDYGMMLDEVEGVG